MTQYAVQTLKATTTAMAKVTNRTVIPSGIIRSRIGSAPRMRPRRGDTGVSGGIPLAGERGTSQARAICRRRRLDCTVNGYRGPETWA